MKLRHACLQLEQLRDHLQHKLDDGRCSERSKAYILGNIAAIDEVLPVAMHEADLRAVDGAARRKLYGVHHVPLAAP